MSRRLRWIWEFEVARERLWPYLADTDWVNRHAGLPGIHVRYEPQSGGAARRFASFRAGAMLVEWEERPTQWEVPEFFAVERIFSRGPLRRFINRTSLVALDATHTQVIVEIELTAASALFEPLLPLIAAQGKRGANRAFRLAAKLAGSAASVGAGDAPAAARFAPLREAGVDERVVAAIAAYVAGAEDRDLARMQPYALADRWKLARRDVLRGFLIATRAGLLNLRWSVICPSCRGAGPPIESLSALSRRYHCPSCNLAFDAVFDRSVEVTFNAAPLGRPADEGLFCIASPQRSAHVRAQYALAPAGRYDGEVSLAQGNYQINVVGVRSVPFGTSDEEGSRELRTVVGAGGEVEVQHTVGSGRLRVAIANDLDREAIVRIEDGHWPDTLVTAAQVSALQEFRDLFSSEVLAPGLELGIESVAVLFTDLVGSTALYARTGDARAFRVVTDHFAIVRAIVARHDGAVVKTIGDAVMAIFVNPVNALEAALQLDGEVGELTGGGEPLRLRVGFHVGPCIVMNANARIDYFGTTVNLAARLQALAQAGEVTLAHGIAQRPDIASKLREHAVRMEGERLPVKGFSHPIEVVRVSPTKAAFDNVTALGKGERFR